MCRLLAAFKGMVDNHLHSAYVLYMSFTHVCRNGNGHLIAEIYILSLVIYALLLITSGVEAGKKAAGEVLALQKRARDPARVGC